MTANVTFQPTTATPPTGTVVETRDVGSGVQRQVVETVPSSTASTAATLATVRSSSGAPAATLLKGSAAILYGWSFYNNASTPRYVKLWNKNGPSIGTDHPDLTIGVPPGAHVSRDYPAGAKFDTALSWAITGGISDTDTTGISADDIHGGIEYL
jgi:hypothetical protein